MLVHLQQDWAASVAAGLVSDGIARFDRVNSRSQFVTLAASLGRVVPHRDSDSDGITTLQNRGGVARPMGFGGFGAGALAPHTDRSGVIDPPVLLLVVCVRRAASGGECLAIDGQRVYTDLATSAPEAVEVLSQPRTALFGGAAGYLGSVFEPTSGGRVRVRYRRDGLAQYSPQVTRWLPQLEDAIDRHTVRFTLEPGEGYVLHNHRWMHGRTAFTGDRVMYRLNLSPHPEFEILPGFALPDAVPGAAP
ncbi:TauD/TfdA family dioxygenase [Nocardia carnea]|uniref:TauD/TfdA family dioxygenase n=1 Tax=Nocardia carnea TaxID=37328 RepID=UPI002454B156|nr:TauD/TfdA family dioxygenase [Nocardia carnea]